MNNDVCANCNEPIYVEQHSDMWVHLDTSGYMCAPQTGAQSLPGMYATPSS